MTRGAVTRPPRIGPRSAGMLMTPQEFDAIPPERCTRGFRYELINGVLVVSPYPGNGEISPNEELGYMLRLYRDDPAHGTALDETLPEQTVYSQNRRRCDRAIWVGLGRTPDPEKDIPAIVVEFVSASRRDRRRDYEVKLGEYMAHGVREYWIVDRFRRTLSVYRNTPTGSVERIVTEAEDYRTDLLPGFSLPLARLLAKADQWPSKRRRKPSARGDS